MLTFKNFEVEIPDDVLNKGMDYFDEHRVQKLTMENPGKWTAIVSGTRKYKVNITLVDESITYWRCNCPYDYGNICKHVVAVIYYLCDYLDIENNRDEDFSDEDMEYISKAMRKIKPSNLSKIEQPDNTEVLLSKLTKAELVGFCRRLFKHYDKAKRYFSNHFSDKLECSHYEKYKLIVQNILDSENDDDDEDYSFYASDMYDELDELIEKADSFADLGNLEEAWAICMNIVEQTSIGYGYLANSNGGYNSVMESTSDVISKIVDKADNDLRCKMFDYILEEYPQPRIHQSGYDSVYLSVLPYLAVNDEQERQAFNILDNRIETLTANPRREHQSSEAIKVKFYYLESKERFAEALELLKANSSLHPCRHILIDKYIETGSFSMAKQLCQEGLQDIKEKKLGRKDLYLGYLNIIACSENNVLDQQKYSEELYWNSHCQHSFYLKLKNLYTDEQWKEKSEAIIDYLFKVSRQDIMFRAECLAKIFLEEQSPERLISMLTNSKLTLDFIDKYANRLIKEYPVEILSAYEKALIELGKIIDRKAYEKISKYLKKMLKIKDGTETVKSLIKHFLTTYKNRRAMVAILKNDFPRLL